MCNNLFSSSIMVLLVTYNNEPSESGDHVSLHPQYHLPQHTTGTGKCYYEIYAMMAPILWSCKLVKRDTCIFETCVPELTMLL